MYTILYISFSDHITLFQSISLLFVCNFSVNTCLPCLDLKDFFTLILNYSTKERLKIILAMFYFEMYSVTVNRNMMILERFW